ncbi:MAG: DUF3150 domain-containing protein [Clostridia bacterium]|jgi:hypothetical protein
MSESSSLVNNLFLQGVICDLDINYWKGRKAAKSVFGDLNIDETAWENNLLSGGYVKLISDELRLEFGKIESSARRWLELHSFGFMNLRFVPYQSVDILMNGCVLSNGDTAHGLYQLQASFEKLTREFLDKFDDNRQKYIDELASKDPRYKAILERIYPSCAQIKEKFGMTWSFFKMQVPTGDDNTLDQTNLDKIYVSAKVRADTEKMMRDSIKTKTDGFIENVVGDLRGRVVDALQKFKTAIETDGTVRSTSITSMRNAIANFSNLNFVGDAELNDVLSKFDNHLSNMGSIKKTDGDLKIAMGATIDSIMKIATDRSNIDNVTGSFLRKIDV